MDNSKLVESLKSKSVLDDTQKLLSISGTFKEIIEQIMQYYHYNSAIFCDRTGLNKTILSDMKNPEYRPQLRTVISICIGLKLNFVLSERLLEATGFRFVHTRRLECAYYKLLMESMEHDLDIIYCNKVLEAWGFEKKHFLGSQER